ncbi:Pentatricopeptide repeat-containing protein, mitochondrial [Symbiodinium microadriaticum]|uniref:Pentatricopeptide repeat-containing protein, mitochondrial n=1 Tax=Symbiodinium microadriaticum TaxID=2951 RepID=A0A1Q9DTV5_SYMMI|nr:Pentatricopeptide repeat-containing protein, mitochondrial [Symbiodinium microadriaticum]
MPSAVESLEVPAPADAEDAAGAGGEASRKKKGAKAVRSKRGREGKPQPEDSGNQWATRIRQCGKMKDLQGALAAMEEAAVAAGISSRQHQEVQNALLHSGDAAGDTASDLFNRLKEEKKADVVTFNIMLRSLLSAGKREEEMNEHGLSANKALLIVRDILLEVASVRLCQDWMKNTDFGITNAACSILLKRITSETAADEVDRSFALIDQLSEPVDEDFPAIGKWCRDPSRQVIEAAIRTSRPAVANKFMEMLGSLRNKKSGGSSAATFGSMIKLHGQNRDLQQVWSTWNLMREKGVHQTAADGLSFILNTVIYSSIIKGFAQAKQPEKCFDVLDEMEEQGIPGNTITYNTLLDACAKCGTMSRVPAVFENMRQRQVEPDRITYSTLIKGYCVAGELDCAFKLFDELKADGKLDLDEIVYNSLLDGCGRKQKPQKAMEYLQVKLLGRARRLNDALKLASDYQKDFGLKLNVQVFTCLMQACLLNKTPGWRYDVAMRVPKAMQIYSDMISHRLGRHGTVSWDVYQTGKPTRYWWSRAQKGSWDVEDGCIQAAAFAEATQAGGAGEIPFRWLTLRDSGDGVLKGFRGFLYSFDERRATLQVRGGKVDRKTADLVLEAIRCWTWQILVESCEAKRARVSVTKKASKAFAEAEEGWQKAGSRGKAWLESGYEAWEKQGSRGFHEKPQRRRYKIFSGQRQIPRLGGSQGQSIQELTLQTLRSILGLELNCSWADIVASQLQSGVDRISSLHPGHKLRERSIRNDPQDGGGQDEWKEEKQEDEEYRSGDSGQELTRQEEDDDEESEAEELRQLLLQAEMVLDMTSAADGPDFLEALCSLTVDGQDLVSKQREELLSHVFALVAARGTFYSFGHLQSGFCAPQLTVIGLMMSEIACAKREQELGDLQADHERQRAEIEELCDVVASRDDEVGRIRSQLEVYEDQHDLQCMLGTSVTSKAQMKATVLALAMAPSLAAWRASEPFVLLQWATGRYWLRAARLEFCIGHSGETVADCGSGKANLDTLPSNTSTMTLYRPHRERDSQQYGPGTEPCHLFISPTADASEAQGVRCSPWIEMSVLRSLLSPRKLLVFLSHFPMASRTERLMRTRIDGKR